MKQKTYIVGYDLMEDKVYVYKDESTASANCQVWKYIDADSPQEAKNIFTEMHKPQIEE